MELAGEGALLKMLEERRKKLAAEGLFDESKKKPIPFLPNTVGVVTSPTGAVIRDIMHRLNDRFPRPVYLYPAIVQGDQAAEQVVAGIEFFNKLPMDSPYRPDVLIVGRGGGSLEDLMPFNDERVVRAIAASDIPIISAVGHETDTTLSDFAADLRAPTPTGAAEKAVPVRRDLINTLKQIDGRMHQSISRVVRERHTHISGLSRGLPHPRRMLENMMQRLDGLSSKIDHGLIQFLNIKKQHMTALSARLSLRPYSQKLNYQAENLERLQQRLHQAIKRNVADKENTLSSKAAMLNTLSFERTLERGFALVKDANGNVITSKATLKTDQNIEVQLKDGKIKADITEV
jgi:exodeoxyribonuclease VII large subunit